MTRKLLAFAVCILVAACASNDSIDTTEAALPDTSPDTTTAAPETTPAPEPEEGSDAADTITMENISFSGTTTVQSGDTIDLVNNDEVPHTFTDEDGSFDVSISPGETSSHTFEEPGEYSYFCTIHPAMTGTITVEG